MNSDQDRLLSAFVKSLIPVARKRVFQAVERSREDVEFELATLANLLTIRHMMEPE